MEKYTLENDIKVLCVTAKSFPEGIVEAHQKMHSLVPLSDDRRYFGISRPNEGGRIVYKAAAEAIDPGEADGFDGETFVIESGRYVSQTVKDFRKDPESIGTVFRDLISRSDIDPNGCCVEWYLNENDVRCMVRLDQ